MEKRCFCNKKKAKKKLVSNIDGSEILLCNKRSCYQNLLEGMTGKSANETPSQNLGWGIYEEMKKEDIPRTLKLYLGSILLAFGFAIIAISSIVIALRFLDLWS